MVIQNPKSRRLIRDVVAVLIVLSTAVLVPVAYLVSQARHDISEQFIHNASGKAAADFRSMVGSMESKLGLVRDWGEADLLKRSDTDALARQFFPIIGNEKLLYGISVADMEGSSFYVRMDGAGYRTRKTDASRKELQSTEIQWNASLEPQESHTTNSVYDPRNRPWFAPALAGREIYWTEPYKFFSTGKIGVTASASFVQKKDQRQVVVAFDILLNELFDEMHGVVPTPNSRVFIFRRDARLYIPESAGLESDLLAMNHAKDELVRKVHSNWIDQSEHVVSIQHEGTVWWCGFEPLEQQRRTIWICVMVPESDILGPAGRRSVRLWGMGIGSVLMAACLAFWLVRRYNHPFETVADFDLANPEASVQKLIAVGENRSVEFKSTMRMNLHAKKPGKEIELAWLKGVAAFLNTDGGTLLLGVTDAGEVTGLERDVFENEDKCRLHFKNLVATHIGADLSKYIRFILVQIDEKTVGVVLCARSEEPVFLKDVNKEAFYIRNGPSSDELPVSKALKYIKHRK